MDTFEGKNIYYDAKGYPLIYINKRDVKLHIYIWEREHGKKPLGHDIHHKDFDKSNYDLSNLELLTKQDHRKVHTGWIKTNGEWTHKYCSACKKTLPLNEFYKRNDALTALCKPCHLKACQNRINSDETYANKVKEYKRKYYQEKIKPNYKHKRGVSSE